jgi:uncharacterized protein
VNATAVPPAHAPAASSNAAAVGVGGAPARPASCLYEGFVRHRRATPRDELRFPLFMAYLDLDELPQLFDGSLLWSARRPAPAWFRRADHLGDPRTPLREAVRALVAECAGVALDGPVRLLTHLRYLGHCFNPVSFYYCFDASGQRVRALVAHVTNTPWGESHSYVLDARERSHHGSATVLSGRFAKRLHVSPLMGMEHSYEWRASEPGARLSVHISSAHEREGHVFDATLSLRRREIDARELRRALIRHPALTLRLTARIYAHALGLRLRGAPYHPHPRASAGGG